MQWNRKKVKISRVLFSILFPRFQGGSKKAKILGKKPRSGNTAGNFQQKKLMDYRLPLNVSSASFILLKFTPKHKKL